MEKLKCNTAGTNTSNFRSGDIIHLSSEKGMSAVVHLIFTIPAGVTDIPFYSKYCTHTQKTSMTRVYKNDLFIYYDNVWNDMF